MPAVPPSVAARVAPALPDAPLAGLELSRLDCLQLGAMFSTEGIPGYGASYLRVVQDSKLDQVVRRLVADPVFRTALKLPNEFSVEELPLMAGDVEGELYVCNVPSDVVWATILFINQTWGRAHGIAYRTSVAHQTPDEFREMLGRFQFAGPDIERIMAARAAHAESADAVFDALLSQSVLFASGLEERKKRTAQDAEQEAAQDTDPDAPGPSDRAPGPGAPPVQIPAARQASNDAIATEVCAEIAARLRGEWGEQGMAELCTNVRRALDDFTSKGISVNEMTGFTQANVFNTSVALSVVFAYTLFGPFTGNEYARRLVDALIMREAPSGASSEPEDEAAPEPDPVPAQE